MSEDIKIVNVQTETDDGSKDVWERMVMDPIWAHDVSVPELVTVQSTYRTLVSPLMDYILAL